MQVAAERSPTEQTGSGWKRVLSLTELKAQSNSCEQLFFWLLHSTGVATVNKLTQEVWKTIFIIIILFTCLFFVKCPS